MLILSQTTCLCKEAHRMEENMKKRNYILAVSMLTMMAVLTGCGEKDTKNVNKAESPQDTVQDDVLNVKASDYVKLGDYKGVEVTYPSVAEVTEEDVQLAIEDVISENSEYKEVDRASKVEDVVNIDYTGTIDGEEFEGGSDTGYDLELGSEDFLPEFEKSLEGKKAGEEAVFTVPFPEDYDEELGGKEAEFTVKINSVSELITPEYNEDFVKSISDFETIEEYEASVREELEEFAKEDSEIEAGENALRIAIDNAEVNGYPQELYDYFYEDTESGYQETAEMFGMEYQEFLENFVGTEDLDEIVEDAVNEYLITQAILEKEGIEVKEKEYLAAAEELAKSNEYDSLEEYEADYGELYVRTQVIREKAVNFLREAAKLSEVPWEDYYEEDYEEMEGEGED